MLQTDAQKHFNSKANAFAAYPTNIRNHDSTMRNSVKRGWNVATAPVSKPDTLRSTPSGNTSMNTGSHPSDKLTADVPSQLASRNADVHTSKQLPQSSAAVINDSKVTVMQSDPQEVTPKLPEELIRAGWKLCWSKQRNRWYVFNVRTGTSSWDVPK